MITNQIPISWYLPRYSKKAKRLVPGVIPRVTDFYSEMEAIKSGSYGSLIQKCRSIPIKSDRENFKAQYLKSLTISGTCKSWRKISNLDKYSGLLGVDIDAAPNPHIKDWGAIRTYFGNRPGIVASFLSASGKGFYFVVRSKIENHKELYDYLAWEIYKTKKIIADPSGSDILRLRFVSDDPGLILKPNISKVPFIEPSSEYRTWAAEQARIEKEAKEKLQRDYPALSNKPEDLYERFVAIQEAKGRKFTRGNRHWALVGIIGMCIKYGMSQELCENLTIKRFQGVDGTVPEELIFTVDHVYNTYTK